MEKNSTYQYHPNLLGSTSWEGHEIKLAWRGQKPKKTRRSYIIRLSSGFDPLTYGSGFPKGSVPQPPALQNWWATRTVPVDNGK